MSVHKKKQKQEKSGIFHIDLYKTFVEIKVLTNNFLLRLEFCGRLEEFDESVMFNINGNICGMIRTPIG
ncbi:Hypothetical predicted protein [Octopus vulgaris]|uniref:Uncharacterized protein n=1 Tax=Octopus vulgaris TaxID=6645 RepID=A0AA36B8K8_OCTVU|nr:Hypothetical predicted protein [Octopus vulgaris]